MPAVTVEPATANTLKIYPNDTVIFDRASVSLDLPDRLIGNTFLTTTKASKLLGQLIRNSSRRILYFSWLFKPLFGDALVLKDTAAQAMTSTTTTLVPELTSEIDNFAVTTMEPETTAAADDVVAPAMDRLNDGSNDV